MTQHQSEAVARFIEDAWQRKDADALRWVIQRAGFALMRCYPPDRGPDILWAVFRGLAGPLAAWKESPAEPGQEGGR